MLLEWKQYCLIAAGNSPNSKTWTSTHKGMRRNCWSVNQPTECIRQNCDMHHFRKPTRVYSEGNKIQPQWNSESTGLERKKTSLNSSTIRTMLYATDWSLRWLNRKWLIAPMSPTPLFIQWYPLVLFTHISSFLTHWYLCWGRLCLMVWVWLPWTELEGIILHWLFIGLALYRVTKGKFISMHIVSVAFWQGDKTVILKCCIGN